jgi:hypothetical protein
MPKTPSLLPVLGARVPSLGSLAAAGILLGSRAGGREPEAAEQPETAEELEELHGPTGRRLSSIAQRAQVKPKPLESLRSFGCTLNWGE